MLIKRTQILFDKDLWKTLSGIAKRENVSIGELIRRAVREKYEEEELLEKRKKAVEGIFAFAKKHAKELSKGEDSTTIIRRMRDTRYGKQK